MIAICHLPGFLHGIRVEACDIPERLSCPAAFGVSWQASPGQFPIHVPCAAAVPAARFLGIERGYRLRADDPAGAVLLRWR
jgi:hypothetical protein